MIQPAIALSLTAERKDLFGLSDQELRAGTLQSNTGHAGISFDCRSFQNPIAVAGQTDGLNSFSLPNENYRLDSFAKIVGRPAAKMCVDELIFLDRSVAGWGELLSDLDIQKQNGRNLSVVLLDGNRNGVHQISGALAGYTNVSSVHIVSHGSDGLVQLGNGQLSEAGWQGYAAELAGWRESLSESADILFYGCNLTATVAGRALAKNISLLTGADVAASSDVTGSSNQNGDWHLEFQTGRIESAICLSASAQLSWEHTLEINIDQAWLDAQGDGPYYLDQAGETYVLQTDVTTAGSAFGIIAQDVVFDLNGHTVTYGNAAPITVANHSFESGVGAAIDDWSFTQGSQADRYQGVWLQNELYDGDYALRFQSSATSQRVTNQSLISLDSNTTYCLSGMIGNKRLSDLTIYVELENTSTGSTHTLEYSKKNKQGIAFAEHEFTTGNNGNTYRLSVGVDSGFSGGTIYVDDIKVQRTRTYGVAVGVHSWASNDYVDFSRFGQGDHAHIRNGKLVQGADGATWGHGICLRQSDGVTLSDMDVTVGGANASAVKSWSLGTHISNCSFNSNVQVIGNRHAFDGTVIMGFQGVFANNQIHGGPHSGLMASGTAASEIYGNTFQLKSAYTNGFAIYAAAEGTTVYENLVDSSHGDYSCRGVFIRDDGIRVFDNVIRVQNLANNQEYQGQQLGGAYGIQIEGNRNIEVDGNHVLVRAEFATGYAFRANGVNGNVRVHNNTFEVRSLGHRAAAFKLLEQNSNDLQIYDNHLITNDGILGHSQRSSVRIVRSTIELVDHSGDWVFEAGYVPTKETGVHFNARFVDSVFVNAQSGDQFDSGIFVNYANGNAETRALLSQHWSTTLSVLDLKGQHVSDAAISVADGDGHEVFSGVTNHNGRVVVELAEFQRQGGNKLDYGPYTITASSGGEESVVSIAADQMQTVEIELDINSPSKDDYTLTYDGTTLYVDATSGDNRFYWSADNPGHFNVDGFHFAVESGTETIRFRGAGGNDLANLIGSSGDDQLTALGNSVILLANEMKLVTGNIEAVNAIGGEGQDRAYFNGSEGDDLVTLSAHLGNLMTDGMGVFTNGFENVVARNSNGHDSLRFLDTTADERFFSYATHSVMYSGGSVLSGYGFESVTAMSNVGGLDKATLFDSSGDDSLFANDQVLRITDSSSVREARGFDRTKAISDNGLDTAELIGTDGQETLYGSLDAIVFNGNGFVHNVQGFKTVVISSGAGDDEFYLSDTAGDDLIELRDGQLRWTESGRSVSASRFVTQVVRATGGGQDRVVFYGSDGDDRFSRSETVASMTTGVSNLRVYGFDDVTAYANGGVDTAIIQGGVQFDDVVMTADRVELTNATGRCKVMGFEHASTYLGSGGDDAVRMLGAESADTLVGDLNWLRMYGDGYDNYVNGYQLASVNAVGGVDAFYLVDSNLDDLAVMRSGFASLSNSLRSVVLTAFERQNISSVNGGADSIRMYDSEWDDNLYSDANYTSLRNSETYHRVNGFAAISVFAISGGLDHLEIHGTSEEDQILLEEGYGSYRGGGLDRYFEGFDRAEVYLDLGMDTSSANDVWYDFELIDE